MGVHPPVVLASRSCPPVKTGTHPLRCSPSRVLAKAGTHPLSLFPPTCHSERSRGISPPGLAPPLLPSSHCLNSLSPATIPPWKYSLPLPPLPCPREGGNPSPSVVPLPCPREGGDPSHSLSLLPCPRESGDPSPSVIPPPVSSRRRGPIPLRHSPSRVLAKAGTHPPPSFPLPCPRGGGDPSPSVIPPPVSSRRRGPIPFRCSPL